METQFKCCGKDVNVFYCLPCGEFYHPSCLLAKKSNRIKKLNARRILCSEKCAKVENERTTKNDTQLSELHEARMKIQELAARLADITGERDGKVEELRAEVDSLRADVENREAYILKLKRRTTDFEDEVVQAEARFVSEIEQYQKTTVRLKDELHKISEVNESLRVRIQESLERCGALETDVRELNEVNRSMLTSIRTLEAENLAYRREVVAMKKDAVAQVLGSDCQETIAPGSSETMLGHSQDKVTKKSENGLGSYRPKLLVVTDDFGKLLCRQLRDTFGDKWVVQLVCKPNANFKEAAGSVSWFVDNYGHSDFVVVLAGLNDRDIKARDIQTLCNRCFHTNLLICTLPVYNCSRGLGSRRHVFKVNSKIWTTVSNLKRFNVNIDCLDLSERFGRRKFSGSGLCLNREGLRRLSLLLKDSISSWGNEVICGLTQIRTVCDSSLLNEHRSSSSEDHSFSRAPTVTTVG